MISTSIRPCFMCATVNRQKLDETIVYEDSFIQVVTDKNSKAEKHLLIYPKQHIGKMMELLRQNEILLAMLRFARDYIIEQDELGEQQFCLYLANCPRHPHLHMQIICGQTTSIAIDGIGTPDHHST